jgi:hypothetical protein
MTDIKLQLKLTPSGDIDCSDGALVISTYVQVPCGKARERGLTPICERLFSDWRLLWTTESSLIAPVLLQLVAAFTFLLLPPSTMLG